MFMADFGAGVVHSSRDQIIANLAEVRAADPTEGGHLSHAGTLHELAAKFADGLWACANVRATRPNGVPIEALKAGSIGLLMQLARATLAAVR